MMINYLKSFSVLFLLLSICYSCETSKIKDAKVYEPKDISLYAGNLYRIDTFPSIYIQPRTVDVWVPENYNNNNIYSVLYMHDGQMLFDSSKTWNKQEWKMDETATELMRQNITEDFIIVAIHNIPEIRWRDLFPEKAMNFMDKDRKKELVSRAKEQNQNINFNGDNYLKFVVKEVKPYIDNNYAVSSLKENTFVAGSSMGGLMSMYAVAEYPNIFEGAACISTHWVGGMAENNNPFPSAIFKYLENNVPKGANHKMYFDYGNLTLDRHYPQYAKIVDDIFYKKGYTIENYRNLFFPGENHSEKSWQKRMNIPLSFLLKKE